MIDLSDFEEFSGISRARIAAPLVSLQNRGGLSLNGPAYEALGKPKTVKLLFNAKKQQIALKVVAEGTPGAHRVRSSGKGHTYLISAITFLRAYDIDYSEYKSLGTVIQGDVAVLDLNGVATDGAAQ